MIKCPTCKGKKTVTCTEVEIGPKGKRVKETFELPCVVCDGRGVVTAAKAAAIKCATELWCSCGNPSEGADYHADGERGTAIHKHHWTCSDCGKILQVG